MVAEREFTTSEAAAVTEQSLNRIQKFIDAGPLPRRHASSGGRTLRVLNDADLLFVWVVSRAFPETDLDGRLKAAIYQKISEVRAGSRGVTTDELCITPFVIVRGLTQLVGELRERVETLERARAMVHSSPTIKGGEPVIRGTRVPVYLVAAMLDQGESSATILENYPSLDEEKLELARVYARATPRTGRPPKHPWR